MAHGGPGLDLSGRPFAGHCGQSDLGPGAWRVLQAELESSYQEGLSLAGETRNLREGQRI